MLQLPFPDGSFDVVIEKGALEVRMLHTAQRVSNNIKYPDALHRPSVTDMVTRRLTLTACRCSSQTVRVPGIRRPLLDAALPRQLMR
jgi:hypothetical protein